MWNTKLLSSVVTSQPGVEPISTSDAKTFYLKEDLTTNDATIPGLVKAARQMVEQYTNRSLITQTRELRLDYFPACDTIELPNGPVQENTVTVQYYDEAEALQTLSTSDYWLDTTSDIARIVIKNSWPATYDRPNAVIVEYDAGYGDAATDVPQPLVQATGIILRRLYNEPDNVGIPDAAVALMSTYILPHYAAY